MDKEILTQATTWMKPENIMLSEKFSYKKKNNVWLHLYVVPRVLKFTEKTEQWFPAAEGTEKCHLMGRVLSSQVEESSGDSSKHHWIALLKTV